MKQWNVHYMIAGLVLTGLLAGGWGLWHTGRMHYLLALSGDPVREYAYGRWLVDHGRKSEALMWMEKAAEYDTRAMVWMGLSYQDMDYFAYPDDKSAFHYFKAAADRKHALAMLMLASMFEGSKYVRSQDGVTSQKANAGALVWYMRAAELGVGPAIDRLVTVYEKGELGESQSKDKADFWRKRPRKNDDHWKRQME